MVRKYTAFISYRHLPLDMQVAQKLHRLIERYRIPRNLRKDRKKELGIVFRDRDELPLSSDLTKDIYEALDHSDFLIVVCTPETPKSQWVRKEIQYFINRHGRDRIMIVLADGTPEESIPDIITTVYAEDGITVLDQIEPLCAFLVDENPKRVLRNLQDEFLRLAAAILGCPYDSLKQRHRRYRARRRMAAITAVSAVILSILFLLIRWNLDISEKNRQIQAQLTQTQLKESEALALLSQQQLAEGDRMLALRTALSGLPSAGSDRAYTLQNVYALSQALYLYNDTGYGFDTQIQAGSQLWKFFLSPSGRYAFLCDVQGYGHLYDRQTGNKLYTIVIDLYGYYSTLTAVEFLEDETRLYIGYADRYYDLVTGEPLELDFPLYTSLNLSEDGSCIAVHQYTYERQSDWSVDHQNYYIFCDSRGNQISRTKTLPMPLNIHTENAGAFSPDGSRYAAAFVDYRSPYLYIFTMDTATGRLLSETCVSFSQLPSEPNSSKEGFLVWGDDCLYYSNQRCLISVSTVTGQVSSGTDLPYPGLAGAFRSGALDVVTDDGNILRYSPDADGSLASECQTIFSCGFPLMQATFSGEDSRELHVLPSELPNRVITLTVLSEEDGRTLWDGLAADGSYEIYPYPSGGRFLVFGSVKSGESYLHDVLVFDSITGQLLNNWDFTVDSKLTLNGFSADESLLIFDRYTWDLREGFLVPLDFTGYEPDPVYGWDMDHAPVAGQIPGYSTITANFNTETDMLTWWSDGKMFQSLCPEDIVDSYYWMNPQNWADVGNNGLILIRNYQGNASRDFSNDDAQIDRSRPLAYAIFSTKDGAWHYLENPCTWEGIPEATMARYHKWVAFADYDGMIRIYDWDTNAILKAIPTDILAQSVSSMDFILDDSVLLIRHQSDVLTAISLADGLVLGEFTLSDWDRSQPSVIEDKENSLLYLCTPASVAAGICISTQDWVLLSRIPRLAYYIPETGQMIRRSDGGDQIVALSQLTMEEMVSRGTALLPNS